MRRFRKSHLFAPIAIAAALVVGCEVAPDEEDEIGPAPGVEVEPTEEVGMESPAGYEVAAFGEFSATDRAQDTGGWARVLVPEGVEAGAAESFIMDARVTGLEEGGHAWHIHAGPCGTDAPVVVPFTPTPDMPGLGEALTPGADGVATQSVTVPTSTLSVPQIRGGDYSVHVHENPGVDHGPTVACANL